MLRDRSDGRWEWRAPGGGRSFYGKTQKAVLKKAREWLATKPEAPKAKVENRTLGEAIEAYLSASKDRLE